MKTALSGFAIAVLAACLTAVVAPHGAGAAPPYLSQNWSGYAAVGPAFSGVDGGWREPAANCFSSAAGFTSASFWVGLGGDLERSHKIEQIGTSADCHPDGSTSNYGWYELWPAPPVTVSLDVSAGDRIRATVEIRGHNVVFELTNTTTGKTFKRTLRSASPDTSSAEWIAEAPGDAKHGHAILPLTNFGTVAFSHASATSKRGHTGTISDPAWSSTVQELASEAVPDPSKMQQFVEQATAVQILPGVLTPSGRGFSVTWARSGAPKASPARTAPPGAM
jgi:Peptidase A4 family